MDVWRTELNLLSSSTLYSETVPLSELELTIPSWLDSKTRICASLPPALSVVLAVEKLVQQPGCPELPPHQPTPAVLRVGFTLTSQRSCHLLCKPALPQP